MHFISTKHTQSAFRLLHHFLLKLKNRTIIVNNVLFLALYGYLIYRSVNKLAILITYSIIAFVSLIYFAIFIISEYAIKSEEKSAKIKKFNYYFEKTRYIFRFLVIVFNFVEYFCINNSKELLIVTLLSLAILILQILFILILYFIDKYIKIFEIAINKDIEESFVTNLLNSKKAINRALNKYANNLEGTNGYSETEIKILEMLNQEIDQYEKEENIKIQEERETSINRIKIVYKNKLEEAIIAKKASDVFLRATKEANKIKTNFPEIQKCLETFEVEFDKINVNEHVKEVGFKTYKLLKDFIDGKCDIKPQELIYLLAYLISVTDKDNHFRVIFDNIKVLNYITNILLENENASALISKR